MDTHSLPQETILYLIANKELGWRKIGIGFGNRLEKWRREGWVLEQQVLFETRSDALLAESMLKRHISSLYLQHLTPLDEGHTESWPYEYGLIDLIKVKEAVDNFTMAIDDIWPNMLMANVIDLIDEFVRNLATGEISPDDPAAISIMESVDIVRDAFASYTANAFVRDREPSVLREDMEALGLNWKELMAKRQDYWSARVTIHDDEVPGPDDSA